MHNQLNAYADVAVRMVNAGRMTEVQAIHLLTLWCQGDVTEAEAARAYVDAEARSFEGDES